jgi:ribosome-associated translation inhibitor RaiA
VAGATTRRHVTNHGELEIALWGNVGENAIDYARDKVEKVIDRIADPVLFSSIKLTEAANPSRDRPALAEAALDVNGDLVRGHVAARQMNEAVDLLVQRLEDNLAHRATKRRERTRSAPAPEPGEWRHGVFPRPSPPYFDRPLEERQTLCHQAFSREELTPEEALFDMEMADYEFNLFTELGSGRDCLIRHDAQGRAELLSTHPSEVWLPDDHDTIALVDTPAPALTLDEAKEALDASGVDNVFYRDVASGRGCVVYHRYDGHYGLITPGVDQVVSAKGR